MTTQEANQTEIFAGLSKIAQASRIFEELQSMMPGVSLEEIAEMVVSYTKRQREFDNQTL